MKIIVTLEIDSEDEPLKIWHMEGSKLSRLAEIIEESIPEILQIVKIQRGSEKYYPKDPV